MNPESGNLVSSERFGEIQKDHQLKQYVKGLLAKRTRASELRDQAKAAGSDEKIAQMQGIMREMDEHITLCATVMGTPLDKNVLEAILQKDWQLE